MSETPRSLHQALLKHGLDCAEQVPNETIWETPVKLHRGVLVRQTELGAYTYVSPGSEIDNVSIGRYCSIGPKVRMLGSSHPTEWLTSHPFTHVNIFSDFVDAPPPLQFERKPKRTLLGHDVWVGMGATVIPGVKIGSGAVIGAGAVVSRDVPDYAVVVGNPARIIKYRFDTMLIERLLEVCWWRFDLPRTLSAGLDLPLDQPLAMLNYIDANADRLVRLAPTRRHIRRTLKGLAIRELPPLGAAANSLSPSPPL